MRKGILHLVIGTALITDFACHGLLDHVGRPPNETAQVEAVPPSQMAKRTNLPRRAEGLFQRNRPNTGG